MQLPCWQTSCRGDAPAADVTPPGSECLLACLTLWISTKLTFTVKSVFASTSTLLNSSSMTLGMTPWLSMSGDQDDPIV